MLKCGYYTLYRNGILGQYCSQIYSYIQNVVNYSYTDETQNIDASYSQFLKGRVLTKNVCKNMSMLVVTSTNGNETGDRCWYLSKEYIVVHDPCSGQV